MAADRVDRVGPRAGGQAARRAGASARARRARRERVRDCGGPAQRDVGDRPRSDAGSARGIARAERIIDEYPDNRGVEAYMGHALAHLRARLGAFDAAARRWSATGGSSLDTGQLIGYWRGAEVRFDVEMLAGDARPRRDVAEEAYAKLSRTGGSMAVPVRVPRAGAVRIGSVRGGHRGRRDRRLERERHRTRAGPGRARAGPGERGRRCKAEELIREAVDIVERDGLPVRSRDRAARPARRRWSCSAVMRKRA